MPLGPEVGLGPSDIVLDADPAAPLQKGGTPPIFGPCLLGPNGCVHQDAIWYGGRPQPRRHCVRWAPSSPSLRGHTLHPIFAPCILWPNGWMDEDATWYGSRSRPRRYCVRWGPRFSADVCYGHTAGWIKMPLSTEVCLGPGHWHPTPPKGGTSGHIVLYGDRNPPANGA